MKTKTGHLPQTLPSGLPKDLYTGKDFAYERTAKGFALRFDPDNVSRIRVRQCEFKTAASDSAESLNSHDYLTDSCVSSIVRLQHLLSAVHNV